MKYSIKFFRNCRVLPKADEVIINYTHKTTALIDFITTIAENQTLVLDITKIEDNFEDSLEIIKLAAEAGAPRQIKVLFSFLYQGELLEVLQRNEIKYFFAEGASTWDDLTGISALGVSDVYIINELGFALDKVSEYCHSKNIQIRCYPNVCQSQSKFDTDNFKKFFIRPEDMQIYNDFVDVIEFFGPLGKQSVLFDIYRDGRWQGKLNDLILGLDIEINSMNIVPQFGLTRPKCMKRCAWNRCHVCDRIVDLAITLNEKGLYLTKEKDKHERTINESVVSNESAKTFDSDDNISEENLS